MYIQRLLEQRIKKVLTSSNKVIIIYGARQVGKTTLVNKILNDADKLLKISGEQQKIKDAFSKADLSLMKDVVADSKILFLDEAQSVKEIGLNIKILHDATPQLKIILTGSSSFELANRTAEPLTGRKRVFTLYPISISELLLTESKFDIRNNVEKYLLYGMYPDVLNTEGLAEKKIVLSELSSSYLYKDVLMLADVRHSEKLHKLLQLLALQIGSTVSIAKLSNALDLSFDTTERYIDLLQKSFVIFRLSGFSRNLSKEISKMDKYYFYDIGIRNAVLNNFTPMDQRSDAGGMWENFLIAERIKHNEYNSSYGKNYFWRLYTGAEIDYIEDYDGTLHAFEIKYNEKTVKAPKSWIENYPNSTFETINRNNFIQFVS